jgi:fatty-acyl-CoA synthase
MTLAAFLGARVDRAPDEPALIDRDRPVAPAALAEEAARLAAGLRALGVRPGDRVAVWLPDVPAWLATFFACARLGAIAVAVNTRFRAAEVADVVGRAGCRAIVCWPGFRGIDVATILAEAGRLPAAEGERAPMAGLAHVIAYDEDEGPHDGPAAALGGVGGAQVVRYRNLLAHAPLADDHGAAEAGCVIFTTSGTTSRPKFVLHDQRTVARHAREVAAHVGYRPGDTRSLLLAPLCGVFGFTSAMAALAGGCALVTHPVLDGATAVNACGRHRVTHAWGSDEMLARMLDAAPGTPALPTVRFAGWAAFSPQHADLPQRAAARGLTLVGLYGMSEVQALCAMGDPAGPLPDRALPGGALISPEGGVRARDPASGAVLPHGQAGELELRVPSRMAGYFGNEAATHATIGDDGWLRTGDLGHTLDERRFVFLARMGDTLRLGGFLSSPADIEDTLLAHPAVAAAQVVGVDTPAGTRAFAFVIARAGAAAGEADLLTHCAARIARYKVPVRVVQLDAFPVTPGSNGTKIQKAKLREMARAAMERQPGP